MATVTEPNPAAIYHDGKGNRILSLTPVQTIMVRYTDPDSKEAIALCYVFGEADYGKAGRAEDRMTGVWLGANLSQLQNQLRLVSKGQAVSILAMMEEKGLVREGRLVATLPTPVELPDVGHVFEDLGKEPETEETPDSE